MLVKKVKAKVNKIVSNIDFNDKGIRVLSVCIALAVLFFTFTIYLLFNDKDSRTEVDSSSSNTDYQDTSSSGYDIESPSASLSPVQSDSTPGQSVDTTPTDSQVPGPKTPVPDQSKPGAASVRHVNGIPKLFVNGVETPPLTMFTNVAYAWHQGTTERAESSIQLAANAGVNIVQISYEPSYKIVQRDNDNFGMLEALLMTVIANNPDAFIILRVGLGLSNEGGTGHVGQWIRSRPGDKVVFADGTDTFSGGEVAVSIASDEWLEGADELLRKIINFVNSNPEYASRVIGYFPNAATTGEWFNWGSREKGVDMSAANINTFRQWLRNKYVNVNKLREAWGNNTITFDTATIPVVPGNARGNYATTALIGTQYRMHFDFYEYNNWLMVDRINTLGKTIKSATNNRALSLTFYGYHMEVPTPISGHFALEALLKSQYVDAFSSPISYFDRLEGGLGLFMAPVDSIQSAGKLWLIESDVRIFHNPDEPDASYNPAAKSIAGAIEMHRREFGAMMVRGMGTWWMDLWGSGWLDDTRIWKNINELTPLYTSYVNSLRPLPGEKNAFKPQVAVIIDEDGTYRYGTPMQTLEQLFTRGVREELYRSGLTTGFYTTADLKNGNIPSSVKLFVMPNAWHIDDDEMAGIKKYQINGNTFLYLSGFGDNSNERIKEMTGMTSSLILRESSSIAITDTNHPITKGLNRMGRGFNLNPTFSLSGGSVLGKSDNANTLVVKENNGWNAIYAGCLVPDRDFYRNVASYVGLNVFIDTGDTLTGNDEMLVIHAREGVSGVRTIEFGEKVDVYDYFSKRWYKDVTSVDIGMEGGKTYYFFYGNKEELVAKNIHGVTK